LISDDELANQRAVTRGGVEVLHIVNVNLEAVNIDDVVE
jgi:hypothetical protein